MSAGRDGSGNLKRYASGSRRRYGVLRTCGLRSVSPTVIIGSKDTRDNIQKPPGRVPSSGSRSLLIGSGWLQGKLPDFFVLNSSVESVILGI